MTAMLGGCGTARASLGCCNEAVPAAQHPRRRCRGGQRIPVVPGLLRPLGSVSMRPVGAGGRTGAALGSGRPAGLVGHPARRRPFTDRPTPRKLLVQQRCRGGPGRPARRGGRRDFPFLGACYGIGGARATRGRSSTAGTPNRSGPVWVTLTEDGRNDPLLRELPHTFDAFTGHKEAISKLPAPPPAGQLGRLPGAGIPGRRHVSRPSSTPSWISTA